MCGGHYARLPVVKLDHHKIYTFVIKAQNTLIEQSLSLVLCHCLMLDKNFQLQIYMYSILAIAPENIQKQYCEEKMPERMMIIKAQYSLWSKYSMLNVQR